MQASDTVAIEVEVNGRAEGVALVNMDSTPVRVLTRRALLDVADHGVPVA